MERDEYISIGREAAEKTLEHVGVKGMKWGVRRSRAERKAARAQARADRDAARSAPSSVSVRTKIPRKGSEDINVVVKPGRRVRAKGGKRNLASDDAIAAAIAKQKIKRSSTDSLSNAELKKAVERMQLEQKYNQLAKKDKTPSEVREAVQKMIQEQGGVLLSSVINK